MSEWISVEDRLPEDQKEWGGLTFIAVVFEDNKYPQWVDRVSVMTPCFFHNYMRAEIVTQSSGAITHWMPLPDPPINNDKSNTDKT